MPSLTAAPATCPSPPASALAHQRRVSCSGHSRPRGLPDTTCPAPTPALCAGSCLPVPPQRIKPSFCTWFTFLKFHNQRKWFISSRPKLQASAVFEWNTHFGKTYLAGPGCWVASELPHFSVTLRAEGLRAWGFSVFRVLQDRCRDSELRREIF